jgi:integrase/recombinase XerD
MRVIEVQTSQLDRRYVLVDDDGELVIPAVRFLKHLDQRGCARNTLRSYAHMLKLYFEYAHERGLDYRNPTLDDIGLFVHWLKLPSGSLKVLPAQPVDQARSNRTINHALTVISGLYDYLWRIDDVAVHLTDNSTTYLPARARRYKGFLYHIAAQQPMAKKLFKQKEPKKGRPKTIPKAEVRELMNACNNQRDRLLIWILYESSIRVGELLALWVEDIDVATCHLYIRDRGQLANGAEIKTTSSERKVEVSEDLINEIIAYIGVAHTFGVGTNHLFLKLRGVHQGQPMTYDEVNSLFRRLKNKTGLDVTPHILRHSSLTALARAEWKPELLQERAGHATFQHTYQMYVHVSEDELHDEWVKTQQTVTMGQSPVGVVSLSPREEE